MKKKSPKVPGLKKINQLRDFIYQEAKDKGWHTGEVDIAAHCANLHGEVSEFWEGWRKNQLDQLCDKADKMCDLGLEPLTCAEEELADIVIRAFDSMAALNVDAQKAIYNKLMFNRSRPIRHGGKKA